ncbi:MAG: hypothetical protein M3350_09890 [Actinomycetota bacterium]|nr:hypothetical protein [Actinomycetota bacterium]
MTPNAPTWGEVEEFLKVDGWRRLAPSERGGSQAGHVFFEKTLDDDRVLQTHISYSRDKRPSPGRFRAILREQLEVSREEFWEALRSGDPVDRPAQVEEDQPVEHEAWVVAVLAAEMHMSADEIQALDVDEARDLVHRYWARPRE